MSKLSFVLGGARSGKSTFAMHVARASGKKVAYIATGQALDSEMKKRIMLHKRNRPGTWKTVEEPLCVSKVISALGNKTEVIVIDCLTLLVSNMFLKGMKEKQIINEITLICRRIKHCKASAIIVSNEVGLGIVPDNKLARDFRDIAGRVNQCVAKYADEVHMMCAGLPMKLK